ncbi:hypothetical protein FQ192_05470 [Pseudomonas sp. ANT_J12]|uniref:DUF7302 family protein n=1 Tax=Pseudomonas sp. ANT_J12 TaxID=2597351 RepID=UPI0011F3EDBC|nr:hypothetical protein [Pseudomonas sp. ANT_J12]KAA0997210.1 hypothetical protein FQ192_05470 [Pseudomonas sp. ANT_J12]
MKIKALWGFVGNAILLSADSTSVKAGQVFDDVDDEYAHTLIGKGLAEEVGDDSNTKSSAPKQTKATSPKENK